MTKYFSEDHEWILVEGDIATIGITQHAADALGDIVFIELKEVGDSFDSADDIGVIESVKAASEIYAPVSGEVVAANTALEDTPSEINKTPESDSWLYKIKISDTSELDALMDLEAYTALIS